jgi:hypothetical protein
MRGQLGALVEVAQRAEAPSGVPASGASVVGVETATDDAPDAEMVALHAWFED